MKELMDYKSEGNVSGNLVTLILAVGISIVIYIFMGVISAQTYQLSVSQISAISNTTIKGYVYAGIGNGFSAYSTTGSYLPLVVLAVVIGLVLTAILSATMVPGVGGAGAL